MVNFAAINQTNYLIMKKFKLTHLLGAALIGFASFTSCTDPCADVTCQNGGTCVEGDCECADGYTGTNCETEERAQFIGSYNVSEACTSGQYTYSVTVSNSSTGATAIIIENFGDYSTNVSATVDGNSVTIASQTNQVSGFDLTFSGSGQISGNILSITYAVSDGSNTDSCIMTCTKQ